jgi:general secretion pathway protein G
MGEMAASRNSHRPVPGRATAKRFLAAGFTLIELLVVMAIVATLLTLAVPRYFGSVEKSKEAVLRQNLATLRDSLDKYYADTGRYPDSLDDLVTKKYIRSIPLDPLTESASTWILIAPVDPGKGMVYDVKSGAQDKAKDGTAYGDW